MHTERYDRTVRACVVKYVVSNECSGVVFKLFEVVFLVQIATGFNGFVDVKG